VRRLPFRLTRDPQIARSPRFATIDVPSPARDRDPNIRRAGFTLVELLVVLAIVLILTSLLMPGLRNARETANKLACASNMRQIGYAITAYATDHNDRLPYSYFGSLDVQLPAEMMAISTGGPTNTFEGIGRLLPRCGGYLDSRGCLYCPSHSGEHTLERYENVLAMPPTAGLLDTTRAYSNYHYRGDVDPATGRRFRLSNDHDFLLLTDGLRTRSDFNHGYGLNLLHGDLAISWYADVDGKLIDALPETISEAVPQTVLFDQIWKELIGSAN
jgi:prepilin-type N-terminal cleavage/methylation domain-containing protein